MAKPQQPNRLSGGGGIVWVLFILPLFLPSWVFAQPLVTAQAHPTSYNAASYGQATVSFKLSEPIQKKDGTPLVHHTDIKLLVTFTSELQKPVVFIGSINSKKDTITIVPDSLLSDGTYTVTLLADSFKGISSGSVLANPASTEFTVDATSPTVTFVPENGDETGNRMTKIILTFSEPVKMVDGTPISPTGPNNTLAAVVNLTDSSGSSVAFSGSINREKTVITLKQIRNLTPGTYTIVLTANQITDNAGNVLTAPTQTPSFTVTDGVLPPPSDFTATVGDKTVTLSWNPPLNDLKSPVTKYQYQQKTSTGSDGSWLDVRVAASYKGGKALPNTRGGVQSLFISPDEASVFVGKRGTDVKKFSVGTPGDISTISETGDEEKGIDSVIDFFFNADGTKIFVLKEIKGDPSVRKVVRYTTDNAWTVKGMIKDQELDITTLKKKPTGLYLNPAGTKLYITMPSAKGGLVYSYEITDSLGPDNSYTWCQSLEDFGEKCSRFVVQTKGADTVCPCDYGRFRYDISL